MDNDFYEDAMAFTHSLPFCLFFCNCRYNCDLPVIEMIDIGNYFIHPIFVHLLDMFVFSFYKWLILLNLILLMIWNLLGNVKL